MDGQPPPCRGSKNKKQGINNSHANKDGAPVNDLWTDGLICAFEFIRGHNWTSPNLSRAQTSLNPKKQAAKCGLDSMSGENLGESISLDSSSLINVSKLMQAGIGCTEEVSQSDDRKAMPKYVRGPSDSYWVPIGWTRISELVQRVQTDASWELEQIDLIEDEEDFTVANVAAQYWEYGAAGRTYVVVSCNCRSSIH